VFWAIAIRRDVLVRALKTAALVGLVLIAINHGDALLAGAVDATRVAKMMLTILVPYSVSTYASVRAIQGIEAKAAGRLTER
jgi:hypothetical protein